MASQPDTMADGLRKVLSQVAQLKLAPDANPDVLQAIEHIIVESMKQVAGQAAGGGGQPQPQMGGDMGGMGMGGMPPVDPTQISPGGGGGMAGLAVPPPNMDELRRVLSGTGASG